jgi:hypothetical protein
MKTRKPRYALHELKRMPVHELKVLRRRPFSGVLEKKELIQLLIDEECIDIIPTPEPVEYKLETLACMKVRQLKQAMEDAGVYFRPEDVVEKADMITIFQNSGRLVLIPSAVDPINDFPISSHLGCSNADARSTVEEAVSTNSKLSTTTACFAPRPTVETVTEDSDDEEDNCEMSERTVSSPEILFSQQEEELFRSQEQTTSNSSVQATSDSATAPLASISNVQPSLHNPEGDTDSRAATPVQIPNSISVNSTSVGGAQDQEAMETYNPNEDIEICQGITPTLTFQNYTILQLQTLARDIGIDLSSCFERSEMVNILVNSGVSGSHDPETLPREMFSSWTVSQLRAVASEAKVDMSNSTSKEQMIQRILYAANTERIFLRDYLRSLSPLTRKRLSDLRRIASELGVDISDCLEKDEIIQRLITRSRTLGTC